MRILIPLALFAVVLSRAATDRVIVAPPGLHLKDSLESAARRGLPVYLLPGTYPISKTVMLPDNTKLIGWNSFDQRERDSATVLTNTANSDPIFTGVPGGKFEIRGIQFIGRNILDFESLGAEGWKTNSQIANIRDCAFFYNDSLLGRAKPGDRWTAIKLVNHDFSVVDRCNLNNYEGFCGIRIAGTRSPDDRSGKNTTQVKVSDCAIRCVRIGISLDQVDNVKIIGNDFGSAKLAGIDLGGRRYDSAGSRGMFTNTMIRDNHFENCKTAVYAAGYPTSRHRWENWGTRIESNGIFVYGPNATPRDAVLDFLSCSGVNTSANSIYIDDTTIPVESVTVVRAALCTNMRFMGDNVAHNAAGKVMAPERILADGGGNTGLLYWGGFNGAANQSPARGRSFLQGDLELRGSLQQEKRGFGAAAPRWPGLILDNNKEIAIVAEVGKGDSMRVLELSEHAAGLLSLCVTTAAGTTCSAFGLGSDGGGPKLSRLSGENAAYSLSIDASRRVVYVPAAGPRNLGRTVLTGTFSGMR